MQYTRLPLRLRGKKAKQRQFFFPQERIRQIPYPKKNITKKDTSNAPTTSHWQPGHLSEVYSTVRFFFLPVVGTGFSILHAHSM